MANIVYGCRTNVAAIYITHITSCPVISHPIGGDLTVQAIYMHVYHAVVTTSAVDV